MNIPIFGKSNPFAKYFRFARLVDTNTKDEREREHNSRGVSQEQIDLAYLNNYNNFDMYGENGGNGISTMSIQFDQYFIAKAQRIAKYREMSYYPDINDGLDMICDEAMVEDRNGEYITLDIKDEVPEHIEEQLRDNWNYLINQVFNLNSTGWELFRRWLVDGELYLELILNDIGDAIIDFKILPPYTMTPIFDSTSDVSGYVQTPNYMLGNVGSGAVDAQNMNGNAETGYNDSTFGDMPNDDAVPEVRLDKDQVVYSNYGYTGRNKLDIRGFLDPSIRIYNQLKYLEDAVVVYRIVRAPERRIWNVGVGKMPKGRAEQYIRGLIQRYRKNVHYDPTTGAMDSSRNFQAMTEDYWFAKDDNGYGTEVTTLAGGQNLGEITDLLYFEGKLHQTLKIPKNRWGGGSSDTSDVYTSGKSGEITREEIEFSRVVARMQNRFGVIFMDAFLTLLRLQQIDEEYIDSSIYRVLFTQSNLWKQYKDIEILEARFGILGAIETYIYKPGENDNAPFSMEFVLKNWFLMNDEEYDENKKYLEKEKEAARLAGQDVGFDANAQQGGGDMGGGFGAEGGDMSGGFGAEGGDMSGGFGAEGGDMGAEGGDVGGDFGAESGGVPGEFDAQA